MEAFTFLDFNQSRFRPIRTMKPAYPPNSSSKSSKRQVEDFVAFLQERYGRRPTRGQSTLSELRAEAFVSMWQDRDEMQDSSAWVRNLRESEWVK